MSVREIPRSFEYECDWCKQKHLQENATGHYHESTPPGWLTIVLKGSVCLTAADIRGDTLLICTCCADFFLEKLNNTMTVRKGSFYD